MIKSICKEEPNELYRGEEDIIKTGFAAYLGRINQAIGTFIRLQ